VRTFATASSAPQSSASSRQEEEVEGSGGAAAAAVQAGTIHTSKDGRQFAVVTKEYRKLKPSIVAKRIAKCRTYIGREKGIRHSPWRMNLVCQFIAGMTVPEALTQLEFLNKRMAPLVKKVVKRTSNLADIRHSLQPSQLEVAECFATKGKHLKRMKIMGRGRSGIMHHKHSHIRLVLREIDFKLKYYQAETPGQKKKWLQLQMEAEQEHTTALAERREMERLEKEQEERKQKAREKEPK